jgi:hypothetical protein
LTEIIDFVLNQVTQLTRKHINGWLGVLFIYATQPDISYAVSVVSRYMHDPRTGHLEAAYRILRYLKSSPGRGLWILKDIVMLIGQVV